MLDEIYKHLVKKSVAKKREISKRKPTFCDILTKVNVPQSRYHWKSHNPLQILLPTTICRCFLRVEFFADTFPIHPFWNYPNHKFSFGQSCSSGHRDDQCLTRRLSTPFSFSDHKLENVGPVFKIFWLPYCACQFVTLSL